MASKVQFKEGAAGSGTTVNVAATTYTAGNSFLVWVGHGFSDTSPVLTDTTHTVTLNRVLTKTTDPGISFFYLHNITGGSTALSLTGVTQGGTVMVQEWSGLSNLAPDVFASNGGNGTAQSTGTTAATSNAIELIIAGANNDQTTNTSPSAVSSGWTLSNVEPDGTSLWPCAIAYKETSSTGTQTNTFTWTNFFFVAGIVAMKEAAAAADMTRPIKVFTAQFPIHQLNI